MTQLERLMAIKLIEQYVESCDERREARSAFFGDVDLDGPAMTEYARETCESAFLFWFAFDRPLADGSFVVGRILKAHPLLSAGERRFLEQMRRLKDLASIFHKMWLESIVATCFPSPLTAESDPMLLVTMRFDVYLPGKIKISPMRNRQQIARAPQRPDTHAPPQVRGHWHRPNPN